MLITREVNLACWCLPWWVDRTQRGSTTRSSTSAVQPWEMQGNIKIGKVGRGTFIENLHSAKWRENCIFFMWCCIWTFSPYLMKLCHSDHAVLLPEPINKATACFCAPPATHALDRSRRKHAAFAICDCTTFGSSFGTTPAVQSESEQTKRLHLTIQIRQFPTFTPLIYVIVETS